jgi:hypothetical protein
MCIPIMLNKRLVWLFERIPFSNNREVSATRMVVLLTASFPGEPAARG